MWNCRLKKMEAGQPLTCVSAVYGPVQIYAEQTLGIGAYGKVCRARCGQLPCAAKLLHDTLFYAGDPGVSSSIE